MMMNCDDAKRCWHSKLDEGGLDEGCRNSQLAEHVARCVSCAQYVMHMERILCCLDELRIESELGSEADSLAGHAARVGRRRRWVRPLAIGRAAAVIALCVGAYSWWNPGGALRSINWGAGQPGRVSHDGGGYARTRTTDRDALPPGTILGMTLRGKSAKRYLAVVQPTTSPDIQMVRLYDSIEARDVGADRVPHGPAPQEAQPLQVGPL